MFAINSSFIRKARKNKENESIKNNKNNYDGDGHLGGYAPRGRGRGGR